MPDVPKVVLDRLRAQPPQTAHPDADVLTAFAEQALPAAEREGVLAHLATCGDCREVVALSLPAQEAVGQPVVEPAVMQAPKVQAEPRRPWFAWSNLRWAALGAAAVVVASALWLRPNKPAPDSMVARVNQEAEGPAAPAATPTSTNTAAATPETKAEAPARIPLANEPAALAKEFQADRLQASSGPRSRSEKSAPPTANKQAPEQGLVAGAVVAEKVSTLRDKKNAVEEQRTDAFAAGKLAQAPAPAQTQAPETDAAKRPTQAEAPQVAPEFAAAAAPADLPSAPQNGRLTSIQKAKSASKDDASQRQFARAKVEASGTSSNYAASYDELAGLDAVWRISGGSLQRSLDTGADWQTVLHPDQPLLCHAKLGREVWTGGQGGLLLHSGDSGMTWTVLHPAVKQQTLSSDITGIVFTKPGAVTLTTATGESWTTTDNGKTWKKP